MNDLNAQQIVLLTLLVSFVTSIATGITTVSLLEQTPEPVNQTINRIVEKTIERVVPDSISNNPAPSKNNGKEIVTVVVNQEDLTVDAVQKNSKSLARIYLKDGRDKVYNSLGVVVNNKGVVLVDSSKIYVGARYYIKYSDKEFEAQITYRDNRSPYVLLSPKDLPVDATFSPAKFADSQNIKLAQTVISLSGSNSNTVSTGIISGIYTDKGAIVADQADKPVDQISLIATSIDAQNILNGSMLLNLQGEIIGLKMGYGLASITDFKPANSIKAFLATQGM